MKYAVLSMDIEDWYYMDYFSGKGCNQNYSMLDGLDSFLEIIDSHEIKTSFFVLGELANTLKNKLREMRDYGHDIGSHGLKHNRPLNMKVETFDREVVKCKHELEQLLGEPVLGYRAPCFSLDRERLEILINTGYQYDSSRILFGEHPLYGEIDMRGFNMSSPGIYQKDNFYEFQISTLGFAGRQIPVSGGGYLRILPWFLMDYLLKKYLELGSFYVLYIHPFEFSSKANPDFPSQVSTLSKFRFSFGRSTVIKKFNRVVELLKKSGYEFVHFSDLRSKLLSPLD